MMWLLRFFPFNPVILPLPTTTTTTPAPGSTCPDSTTWGGQATCPPPDNHTLSPQVTSSAWITNAERIGYSYIMPLVCMTGIILNALTVLVLTRKGFRAPTYVYLVALSLADLFTCLVTLPIGAVRCGPCVPEEQGYGRLVYEVYVWVPLSNTSENVSAWMTVVLATDRMLTLKKPMDERSLPKFRRRALWVISGVVMVAVLMNMPFFFAMDIVYNGTEYQVYFSEFGDSQGFVWYSWVRAVLVHFTPLTLLVFVNVYLVYQVRKSQRRLRRLSVHSRGVAREKAQTRLTLMLVGTVLMFILGHISIAFGYTIIFQAVFGEETAGGPFYANWRVTTHLIAMLSYSLDFVVYCLINRIFREATVTLFTCMPRRSRKVTDASSSSHGRGAHKSTHSDDSARTKKTSLDTRSSSGRF